MPSLTMQPTWTFALSTAELRLVLKALGSRIDEEGEWDEAAALCDKLTELRARTIREQMAAAEQLEKVVKR